jgi:hypothetical protein
VFRSFVTVAALFGAMAIASDLSWMSDLELRFYLNLVVVVAGPFGVVAAVLSHAVTAPARQRRTP